MTRLRTHHRRKLRKLKQARAAAAWGETKSTPIADIRNLLEYMKSKQCVLDISEHLRRKQFIAQHWNQLTPAERYVLLNRLWKFT